MPSHSQLALVVAPCLVSSILSACGSGGSSPGSSAGAPSSSSAGSSSASSSGSNTAAADSGASSGANSGPTSGASSGSGSASGAGSMSGASSSSGSASGSSSGSSSGIVADGGTTGCPALTGADKSYARWRMPNPASQNLPNPSSYTDLGDGTLRDNVTGLIWQKDVASSQAYAWAAAQMYCSGLTLAGRTWHLPSRVELLSLVDFTKTPSIDGAFPAPPGGKYHWTSTSWVVSQIS